MNSFFFFLPYFNEIDAKMVACLDASAVDTVMWVE